MSGSRPGALAPYNSLTDKHLVGYFSNVRIRRHLQRSGLISRSGRIIPEREYQLNALRKDHQQRVQEYLARAIRYKVLDVEQQQQQLEAQRKSENSVRKEKMQRLKVERCLRSVEGGHPAPCPHPPAGPRVHQYPLPTGVAAGRSHLASRRPNTAPGDTQPPLPLQPRRSCAAVGSVPKASSSKRKCRALECDQQSAVRRQRSRLRPVDSEDCVTGRSPYQLPIMGGGVIPVPPPPLQKGDQSLSATRTGMLRGRRFRPLRAPGGMDPLLAKDPRGSSPPPSRSSVSVSMVFLGESVRLSRSAAGRRDEVRVYQQHCGGENLCVYKGSLSQGETFQFVSKRHRGFPFSLTFFLNGMQVDRLSCCCEYRHHGCSRLGGRQGHFGFLSVQGASPCYRCLAAMGLDKRKAEGDHQEKRVGPWGDGTCSEQRRGSAGQKPRKSSLLVVLPSCEAALGTAGGRLEAGQDCGREEECDEEFEADEGAEEEQMKGRPASPSGGKARGLVHEERAPQGSDSERDEGGRHSDGASEGGEQGRSPARSLSSVSSQDGSADSPAERAKGDAEGEEVCGTQRVSGHRAHAERGRESGQEEPREAGESREPLTPEREGADEAEKTKAEGARAEEDTGTFQQDEMRSQHPHAAGSGELQRAVSAESTAGEDGGTKAARDGVEEGLAPLGTSATEAEDGSEESPQRDGGGAFEDDGPVQEETAKATGNDGRVTAEPAAGGSHVEEEEEEEEEEDVTRAGRDDEEVPAGAVLAGGAGAPDGQMAGETEALEEEDSVAEEGETCTEGEEEMSWVEDELPEEGRAAVLQTGRQRVVEEPAPEEGTVAEEDIQGRGQGREWSLVQRWHLGSRRF